MAADARCRPLLVRCLALLSVCSLALGGCASHPAAPVPDQPLKATLLQAGTPRTPYLNVSVRLFDVADQSDDRLNRIYSPVRDVERNYLPVLLRNTLIDSGHWGAVKVAPAADESAELQIRGTILRSTAAELILDIRAYDSRGVAWLDRTYRTTAATVAYSPAMQTYPFQGLLNQVANDIWQTYEAMPDAKANAIVRASLLRYAIALSPDTFSGYLEADSDGVIQVTRLPATDDAMYTRVKKIRETEYRFTDLLDEQFDQFYARLVHVYPFWLRYSYELLTYNHQIAEAGTISGSRRRSGSWEATEDVFRTFREFKLNEDELRELATSFREESHPTVTRLENRVIELSGPLQDQYVQWRALLKEMYAAER